jgi:hypothetical protein
MAEMMLSYSPYVRLRLSVGDNLAMTRPPGYFLLVPVRDIRIPTATSSGLGDANTPTNRRSSIVLTAGVYKAEPTPM